MARVFVTRNLPGPALERLKQTHDTYVWPHREPPNPFQLKKQARDAEGLLTLLTDRVDQELIEHAPHLRAISNYAVGTDNIDLEAATARNIPVGNTPDVLTEATADLTFALILASARKLDQAIETAKHDWLTWEPGLQLGLAVHGRTLGIIGYGRIGKAVEKRAQGFEMKIVHTKNDDLHTVLETADFVTVHTPLTDKTRHLIGADELKAMKPTAILVNTARGAVIDQQALISALNANTIAGAAIDVTDPEPPKTDDPIHSPRNLIVVPHIGSATTQARHDMAEIAVTNLISALAGEPMLHQANKEA
jgi:glyoxylate reductase